MKRDGQPWQAWQEEKEERRGRKEGRGGSVVSEISGKNNSGKFELLHILPIPPRLYDGDPSRAHHIQGSKTKEKENNREKETCS